MNTEITYRYKDAHGYNFHASVVVESSMPFARLQPYLDADDENTFCPADVGLKHPGNGGKGFPGPNDHCICTISEDDVIPTTRKSTIAGMELINRFRRASLAKWPAMGKPLE